MENHPTVRSKTVLLVDDSDENRILTKWFLDSIGYTVDAAQCAEEALSRFNANAHDLVMTDNTMPGMSGAELAHIIKLRSPTTPILMYSGNPPEDQSSLDMVILKPAHLNLIKEAVDKLLSKK